MSSAPHPARFAAAMTGTVLRTAASTIGAPPMENSGLMKPRWKSTTTTPIVEPNPSGRLP
jgi:hypothetical protein